MDWEGLIQAMIQGIFVGIGGSFGAWIVARHFTRRLEQIEEKLAKRKTKP